MMQNFLFFFGEGTQESKVMVRYMFGLRKLGKKKRSGNIGQNNKRNKTMRYKQSYDKIS